MKKTIIRLLIGLLIIIVTMLVIAIIKPFMPFVSNEVWSSIEISFGVTYIIFNPNDLKTVDKRVSFIIYILISILFIFIGTCLEYLF